MALEDLTLKIDVGLKNASSALDSLGKIDDRLIKAQASATRTSDAFHHLATTTGIVSSAVAMVGTKLSFFGKVSAQAGVWMRQLSGSVLHVVHSIHAVQIAIDLLSTAFAMLMVPIRIIGTAIVAVFRVMNAAMSVVLLPLKLLWAGLSMVARVIAAIITPLIGLAAAAFKVWFIFKGWMGAIKMLWGWLNMLPPKIRILVGGLLLLGVTGKAGALALRVVASAARLAATGLQLFSLPVLVLVNPMRALAVATGLLGRALAATGGMAMRAAGGLMAFGRATLSVAGSIATRLASGAKAAATALLLLGTAAAAWGVKLAVKAETATVILGTMLKSMSAGKALMTQMENWSGAPLFNPDEIQLSGMLLFKAGVAAKDITGKLDQLGEIAAATKTPLDELARIYQQGMNQGAFQQDKINQLSDRGIAIYEGLAHATGKSGLALKEMIRDGKIGPTEMNAALAHLTTGHGIYAGAMQNIAQTAGGMWATLTNKAAMAARELGINLSTAFDFKGLMTRGIEFFNNLKTQIANAMPAFMAIATVVRAAFAAIWEIATVTFAAITGTIGITSSDWMKTFLEFAAIATWAFQQWPDIATLAFVNVALALVRFGGDWHAMFMDVGNIVVTVFSNIGTNIKNAMKEIWDFIKSGGTNSMQFAFTPLLDGFKEAVREIGPIESNLAATSERLGETLGASLGTAIDANMKMLADFKIGQNAPAPTLDGAHAPSAMGGGGEDTAGSDKNKRTSFAVEAMNRGSEAAMKAIYASMGGDKVQDAQLKQQTQMVKHLSTIAKSSTAQKPTVQGAV